MTIYTNFKLPDSSHNIKLIGQSELGAGSLYTIASKCAPKALLIANPSTLVLIRLGVLKSLKVIRCPIFIFDLILKRPSDPYENVIAKVKGFFIKKIEHVIVIHRDTKGYQKFYGLKEHQFIYVPFKANNIDLYKNYDTTPENYVVALGASQRDYKTLIAAAEFVDEKIVIVCSDENAKKHNADVGDVNNYPHNVTRVRESLESNAWYEYLAKAKLVVVPILSSAIQPAGISVYLEAMIFKKAVIITEGASTNYILENGKEAILVPPDNPFEIAKAINMLASDSQRRERLEENGFQYASSLGNDATLRGNILNIIISKLEK